MAPNQLAQTYFRQFQDSQQRVFELESTLFERDEKLAEQSKKIAELEDEIVKQAEALRERDEKLASYTEPDSQDAAVLRQQLSAAQDVEEDQRQAVTELKNERDARNDKIAALTSELEEARKQGFELQHGDPKGYVCHVTAVFTLILMPL